MAFILLAVPVFLVLAFPETAQKFLRKPPKVDEGTFTASVVLREDLKKHIVKLAKEIGDRNETLRFKELEKAALYIEEELEKAGCVVTVQEFKAEEHGVKNIIGEVKGSVLPDEIYVVGAHYDTCFNPGADDNASGVAGLIEIAKSFKDKKPKHTVRFVAFANEEPPFFRTKKMGSLVYARSCKEKKENIKDAIVLESIGYFDNAPGSQKYPEILKPYFPDTGNFVAMVGNISSALLVNKLKEEFGRHSKFPVESVSFFETLPAIGLSDHWAFWQAGYKAVMISDTAPFRNPYYHTDNDKPETLNYAYMAEVVNGLGKAITALVNKD